MSRKVIPLRDERAGDARLVGRKAATLARLARAGYPVPEGLVVTVDAESGVASLVIDLLGDGPFAVRSSGVSEDEADTSWAGQYESLLDVTGIDALGDAIEHVRASGATERARSYGSVEDRIPVLIQRQVPAAFAGVAFSADPISGERGVQVVTATRGLGVAVVEGTGGTDTWRVTAGSASRTTGTDALLDRDVALEIAALAARVEQELAGGPVDIEWARTGGALWLLQARPMTALPGRVDWTPPLKGAFARNFRLGEWLGDPVTPLFESWLLTRMEDRLHEVHGQLVGVRTPRPLHVVVHGWYFYSLAFLPVSPAAILRSLPHVLPRLIRDYRRVAVMMPPVAHLGVALWEREWRDELLPRYLRTVERAEREVPSLAPEAIPPVIDELADQAGEYFASITIVAGYAWKAELPLARFYGDALRPRIGGSHLELLQGLHRPASQAHDVVSLDWYQPTLGEAGATPDDVGLDARLERLADAREAAEKRCRAALAGHPKRLARFERVLGAAQRAIPVREEQLSHFTRSWPVLRAAVLRIGEDLSARGVIGEAIDVFFLTRTEVGVARGGDMTELGKLVRERRIAWRRQRRLVPPLVLGSLPRMLETLLRSADDLLRGPVDDHDVLLRGAAASAGRATGPARVVHDTTEFARVHPGDVLVCPATTPAWTQLFARVAAIVTDTGSPSSHASIVAREYGIPAVVGTGDATARVRDGQLLTVDGAAGTVSRL